MRTIFFGTPSFAVPTLERLLASRHEVVAIITQPDRPRGRGHQVSASPIKQMIESNGPAVLQPERMKDPSFVAALRALSPDLGVVAAYGRLLPNVLLELPRLGVINVHASLLPKYRGAAPIHRAIMAGETETGVTIMRLVREMDAGPMLRWITEPIALDDTSVTLEQRLAEAGAQLLMDTIDELDSRQVIEHPQNNTHATFAPRITQKDGLIDWERTAGVIHNQVRGLHPWPRAYTYIENLRYLVLRTSVVEVSPVAVQPGIPVVGQVLESTKDRLVVAAGQQTAILLHELQPEGRRPLTTRAVLAGHPLRPGVVFGLGPS